MVDKLNLVTREMLTGLMVVRAFNTQNIEEKKFEKANVDLTQTTLFINRIMVFMMPAMMLLMNGVMLLIVWVGAHQIDAGAMQVGNMMAFMQYSIQIIMAFLMVSIVFVMMPRAAVSAQRIAEVLETEPGIKDPEKPVKFGEAVKGRGGVSECRLQISRRRRLCAAGNLLHCRSRADYGHRRRYRQRKVHADQPDSPFL